MSSFEQKNIEVPQRSPWHVFTGTIVLTFGFIGGTYLLAWLVMF